MFQDAQTWGSSFKVMGDGILSRDSPAWEISIIFEKQTVSNSLMTLIQQLTLFLQMLTIYSRLN